MTARVVDAVADELWEAGIRRVYGIPGGGSNMELIDALSRRGLRFVLAHQETSAIFMAAAEAEVSGAPGVCVATVGPGVANSLNGLAHCRLDRVPLLLFTDRPEDRTSLHQALDHRQLVEGAVKRSRVLEPGSARCVVRASLAEAADSPRGPLHLDLAPSVASAAAGEDEIELPMGQKDDQDASLLHAAADQLAASSHPVALLGLGAREQATVQAVRSFVERFEIPVLCTYKAKGVLPDDHRLAAGLVTNGALEGRLLDRANALIAIGFDAVELMPGPWSWPLPTVTVGREGLLTGPLQSTIDIAGDAAPCLGRIAELLAGRGWSAGWSDERPTARVASAEAGTGIGGGPGLAPATIATKLCALAPDGAIATVDAGSHMFAVTLMWTATAPSRFLISNGLATMGYGLPAAIGASLASPDDLVVCFTGDGGLAMAAGELATAARAGSRLIIVVFNDGMLNLIKIKQEKRGKTTEGLDFEPVEWAPVARGMGLQGFSAVNEEELTAAFVDAVESGKPALIDVAVDASSYGNLLTLVRG